jgi:hypothetical protein
MHDKPICGRLRQEIKVLKRVYEAEKEMQAKK